MNTQMELSGYRGDCHCGIALIDYRVLEGQPHL
jgi:hypothetical protein